MLPIALKFLLSNWRTALPIVALVVVAAWGGWQHWARLDAENALATQKLQTALDANATWLELEDKRRAFEEAVLNGIQKLNSDVAAIQETNQQFRAKVNANANSGRALDANELDALGMLSNSSGDKAGGRPLRPANAPAPVR